MIEKALKYINSLKEPVFREINGELYADAEMQKVVTEPYASRITLTTLSSLVEYIKCGVDKMKGGMFVHVKSPTEVSVFSQLDKWRSRECVVNVCAELPTIITDRFVEKEMFNIALQSKFVDNKDKKLLLQFTGTVEEGTVQQYGDDGVTQKATIKTGITSKSEAIVPNPVVLKPYRTFTEVDQPESAFVFRMQSGRVGGVECAIYEADGGAWKKEAMDNIKAYLKEALKDVEGYTIIS